MKKFALPSYYLTGRVSGFVKSSENINSSSSSLSGFKELYIRTKLVGYDVSIGKEIIDLSTSKIFTLNDFLSPQISILNPFDRSLNALGVEGFSIGIPIESIASSATVYLYKNNLLLSNDQDNFVYLGHLKHIEEALIGDIFAGRDKASKLFLSTAASFYIDTQTNMYFEIKKQSNWEYIAGIDYSLPGRFSLAFERISKQGEKLNNVFSNTLIASRENNASDAVILDKIVARPDFANGTLLQGEYFGLFARFPLQDNLQCNALFQYNMGDSSYKLSLQTESKVGNLRGYVEYTHASGSPTMSEYGLESEHSVIFNISFDVI